LNADEDERKRIIDFTSKFGELGLKAFLTLDYAKEDDVSTLADNMLSLFESSSLSHEVTEQVLSHFYRASNRAFELRGVFETAEKGLAVPFAAHLHEALIRKFSEYLQAIVLVEQGKAEGVTLDEVLKSMGDIEFALGELQGLYKEGVDLGPHALSLIKKPHSKAEYVDAEGSRLEENAVTTWELKNGVGTSVVTTIRPEPTYTIGNRFGGGARVNFAVKNREQGCDVRIAIDTERVMGADGVSKWLVSLDLGTLGKEKGQEKPSEAVSRMLKVVESSEGGHNYGSFELTSMDDFRQVADKFSSYMHERYQ
jgi:hypothetical protein